MWHGSYLLVLTGIAAVTAVVVSAQARAVQEQTTLFRSTVDVVSLNVTVVDNQNRYITDLTEGDFSVFEDGTRQDLIVFNRTSLPIALSLLIDTSASMESRMRIAQDAAIGFVRKLRPAGPRAGRGLRQPGRDPQDFTNNVDELERRFVRQARADPRRCTTRCTSR
jgi:VWFA-related protein